jgi:hypothetical protein
MSSIYINQVHVMLEYSIFFVLIIFRAILLILKRLFNARLFKSDICKPIITNFVIINYTNIKFFAIIHFGNRQEGEGAEDDTKMLVRLAIYRVLRT